MPAELHIIGLIVVFFGVAYFAIYPRMEHKTILRMMKIDVVLFIVLLLIAGTVYYGSNLRFSMIFFDTNWWIFTVVCACIIETPFFLWFCHKWNIDISGDISGDDD